MPARRFPTRPQHDRIRLTPGAESPRPAIFGDGQAALAPPGHIAYWLGAIVCSHDTFGFMSAKVPVGLPFQAQTCSS